MAAPVSDALVFFGITGDPVLGNATPVHDYEPNTWGPAEADALIADVQGWHNPIGLAAA